MKNLYFQIIRLFPIFLFISSIQTLQAQSKADWNRMLVYESEGKIKSADQLLDTLFLKAKKKNDDVMLIKCVFLKAKYLTFLDEKAFDKSIALIDQERKTSHLMRKSILDYARLYFFEEYLKKYHPELEMRDKSKLEVTESLQTWGLSKIKQEIETGYQDLIANPEALFKLKIRDFHTLFEFETYRKDYDKSLLQFLIERRREYWTNRVKNRLQYLDLNVVEPLYFVSREFTKIEIPNQISMEQQMILKDFQLLESYLLSQKKETYLLGEVILERFEFLTKFYPNQALASEFLEKQSHEFSYKPSTYLIQHIKLNNKVKAHKLGQDQFLEEALFSCDSLLKKEKPHFNLRKIQNLQQVILNQQLNMTVQNQVMPNVPILTKVDFKNIDSLYIRIHKAKQEIENQNKYSSISQAVSDSLLQQKPFRTLQFALPQNFPHDYVSTEIALDGLPSGFYIVQFSDTKTMNQMQSLPLLVNSLYIFEYNHEGKDHWQIKNFETGEAIRDAKVIRNGALIQNDAAGEVSFENNDTSVKEYFTTIMHQEDTLHLYDINYSYRNPKNNFGYNQNNIEEEEVIEVVTSVFVDRGIYRPGQTVFFKGILLEKDKNVVQSLADMKIYLTISDNNYKTIFSKAYLTNEFGSFSGEFEIPKTAMTGNYTIELSNLQENDAAETVKKGKKRTEKNTRPREYIFNNESRTRFKVEEYKRPTFEVLINSITERFAMNDTVKVSGKIIAFAGNNMQGSTISYEVERSFRSYYERSINLKDIVQSGTLISDEKGAFEFDLVLKKFESESFIYSQAHYFRVKIIVTDKQGESHEVEKQIYGREQSIDLSLIVSDEVKQHEELTIYVGCKNNDDEDLELTTNIDIFKIKKPKRIHTYKTRPWQTPNLQMMTEAEFEDLFPNFVYDNTKKIVEERELVYSKKAILPQDKKIQITDLNDWEDAEYEIVHYFNDPKDSVSISRRFKILPTKMDWKTYEKSLEVIWLNEQTFRQDKKVVLEIRSFHESAWVVLSYFDLNKKLQQKHLLLQNGILNYEIPIDFSMNIFLKAHLLKHGIVYQNSKGLNVKTKELLINQFIGVSTFRSTLEPGRQETWSFQIKNPDHKKGISEVLATMYDKSLDQFENANWYDKEELMTFKLEEENELYAPYFRFEHNSNNTKRISYYNNQLELNNRLKKEKLNIHGYDTAFNRKFFNKHLLNTRNLKNPILIKGVVYESGQPLPGAVIVVNDASTGTQSDFDGEFSLIVEKGETITIVYIGLKTQEFKITSENDVRIDMEGDLEQLEGVVVSSYATTSKVRSNIASTTVSSISYEQEPSASFIQTLIGQVPGLQISTGSGSPGDFNYVRGNVYLKNKELKTLIIIDGVPSDQTTYEQIPLDEIENISFLKDAAATSIYGTRGANGVLIIQTKKGAASIKMMQVIETRKNFKETAFFMPHILTDKNGNFNMTFDSPESLTKWRFRMLSHNKKGEFGYFEEMVQTQKQLMVQPNTPRFVREGDTLVILNKIVNLIGKPQQTQTLLQLFDAKTAEKKDALCLNGLMKSVEIPAFGSSVVAWKIAIPEGLEGLHYKIVAQTDTHSDGEEKIIPVLPKNILIHESEPLWVKSGDSQTINLDEITKKSTTRNYQLLQAEITTNLTMTALQTLPYLIDYEHQCAEQTFSRLFATTTAEKIISNDPKIQSVLEKWRQKEIPMHLILQDETLRNQLMKETPWLFEMAFPEAKQQKMAALLDVENLRKKTQESWKKLADMQNLDGGFPWFDGGKSVGYISRFIATGLGQMKQQNEKINTEVYDKIVPYLVQYLDTTYLKTNLKYLYVNDELHYWYARSYFTDAHPLNDSLKKHQTLFLDLIKPKFLKLSLYEKGLAAIVFHRSGNTAMAQKILTNLKETTSNDAQFGMYWIGNKNHWRWDKSDIATQSLLIQAFSEINNDVESVDAMCVWLIKQKQANQWPTTKSTTEAIFTLLNYGSKNATSNTLPEISWGSKTVLQEKIKSQEDLSNLGILKLSLNASEIKPEHNRFELKNTTNSAVYGGLHRYYYESIDAVKSPKENALSLEKIIFYEKEGKEIIVEAGDEIPLGTKLTIRLLIHASESVDFVHVQDLRAAGFETVYEPSGYQYNAGSSYYQSHRDWASHFFFDHISKGMHLIEYDVMTNNMGQFSSGIATIMSMYAPEFSYHTEGKRIEIVDFEE
uniref:alpha-2-macroglobulin family protein n=1 Tax=Flavobacterium sp. TaxID=239 RepID=UPI004048FAC5